MLRVQDVFAGYYKDINILQGISMEAEASKTTIIIGGNGVGKSTLLKTIYGFLLPNRGSIHFKNEDITSTKPYDVTARGISYVTQHHSIFPYLNVKDNLELGAWTLRGNKKLIQQRLLENFERFKVLGDKKKAVASSLSGGQQRMLEIARALMTDPEMILFDEPSAGLAPRMAKEIYNILERLKEEEGRGVILVDQNVRQAMEIADHVYIVEMGRVKIEGTREDFDADLKEMIKDWF